MTSGGILVALVACADVTIITILSAHYYSLKTSVTLTLGCLSLLRFLSSFAVVLQPRVIRIATILVLGSGIAACIVDQQERQRHHDTTKSKDTLILGLLIVSFVVLECSLLLLFFSSSTTATTSHNNKNDETNGGEKDLEAPLLKQEEDDDYDPGVDTYQGTGSSVKRLISLAYPERYVLFVATIALGISSAATIALPALFGDLIQTISVTKDEARLNHITVLLIILFVVSSLFAFVRGALYTLAGERLVARFRTRLFDAVVHLDVSFFDKNQSGELQSRLSSDTQLIQSAVTVNVSMSLRWVVQAIVSFVIDLYISWKLTLVMFCIVPPLALGARLYGVLIRDLSKKYQESLASAAEAAEEAFGNLRTVRAFSKEAHEVKKYNQRVQTAYEFGARKAWGYGFFIGVVGLAAYMAIALVLWLGGRMVIRGDNDLSPADLTSFLLYTLNLAVSLGGLADLYSTFMNASGAAERSFALLDMVPQIPSRAPPKKIKTLSTTTLTAKQQNFLRGEVRFEDVWFAYPTRPEVQVLRGVSFVCPPGKTCALVGTSGSGKSTTLSLILRHYDPTKGTIFVDGVRVSDTPLHELHRLMAAVSQEPSLFASSIADNIAYGVHFRPTREQIVEAAKKANALDFIQSFPDGFDTLVGERGVQLSGGQKQRIAIARAILVDPVVLLLDEATSALDSTSEHLVQVALDELMKDRTTIVVAHRLSTIKHASCIFCLDEGRIVEQGTHEELLEIPQGQYASLYSRLVANERMRPTM